ncbi:MAG: SRPBCC domain-containing protein [Imperialibacter sp.]
MNKTVFTKDLTNKKILVERSFDAPVALVWKTWTDATLLDQWWAPSPWKAKTKSMNFKEGGYWHYCMVGPEGEVAWARLDYEKIKIHISYSAKDAFCDEAGKINKDFPGAYWQVSFSSSSTGTKVNVVTSYNSVEELEAMVNMGFQEGFAMAHDNLDELIKTLV